MVRYDKALSTCAMCSIAWLLMHVEQYGAAAGLAAWGVVVIWVLAP